LEVPKIPQRLDYAQAAALAVSPNDFVAQLDFCERAVPLISYYKTHQPI
jgi:hypothetical protein